MIALNFSSSSDSVKFCTMVHQVTLSISFFSECLEIFSDFHHISVGPSNVIPLDVFDVRPHRKSIYLIFVFVRILVSLLHCICLNA